MRSEAIIIEGVHNKRWRIKRSLPKWNSRFERPIM